MDNPPVVAQPTDSWPSVVAGAMTTFLYGKFNGFDSNGFFSGVVIVWFSSYALGSCWAALQHATGKEKFEWAKSVQGIFRLLGWFSCFSMAHVIRITMPNLHHLAILLELIILITECGLLLKKVFEITGIRRIGKVASAVESTADVVTDKLTSSIESIGRGEEKNA